MSEAAVQAWLPNVEAPNRRTGIYPAQWFQGAFQRKEIVTAVPLDEAQLQPASLDLRLGEKAHRVPASFLPGRQHVNLKKRMSAVANPKSSTGRLDVFARVISNQCTEFDTIDRLP